MDNKHLFYYLFWNNHFIIFNISTTLINLWQLTVHTKGDRSKVLIYCLLFIINFSTYRAYWATGEFYIKFDPVYLKQHSALSFLFKGIEIKLVDSGYKKASILVLGHFIVEKWHLLNCLSNFFCVQKEKKRLSSNYFRFKYLMLLHCLQSGIRINGSAVNLLCSFFSNMAAPQLSG